MNENDNEDGYDGSRWRFNKMIYVRSKDEDDKEDRDDDEASYFYEIIKNRFEKNKKYYIDYDHEKYINKNLENYLIKNESLCACNGLILPFKFRFNKLKTIQQAVDTINAVKDTESGIDGNMLMHFSLNDTIEIEKRININSVTMKIMINSYFTAGFDKTDMVAKYLRIFSNDRNKINEIISYIDSIEFYNMPKMKKLIEDEGFIELLNVVQIRSINKKLSYNDTMRFLKKIDFITDKGLSCINADFKVYKEIAMELARLGGYRKGQYIDKDVAEQYSKCDAKFIYRSLSSKKLEEFKGDSVMITRKLLTQQKKLNISKAMLLKVLEISTKDDPWRDWIHDILENGRKEKFGILDLMFKKLKLFKKKIGKVYLKFTHNKFTKFIKNMNYLVWFIDYDSDEFKKYYFVDEAYKYIDVMFFNMENLPLDVIKELYKRLGRLPTELKMKLDDDGVRKFLYDEYERNPLEIRNYLLENIRQPYKIYWKYYSIITRISKMKKDNLMKEIDNQLKHFIFEDYWVGPTNDVPPKGKRKRHDDDIN